MEQDKKTKNYIKTMSEFLTENVDNINIQDDLKIDAFSYKEQKSFEFSMKYKGGTITGDVFATKYHAGYGDVKKTYIKYEFHDIKGFDWDYYDVSDKDYVTDGRSATQKRISLKIRKSIAW